MLAPQTRKRAAIYARFSTDMQRDKSIEDQVDLCRKHAERLNCEVVAVYSDRARSGASLMGRDGVLDMISASRRGEFDAVIVEALDRLSRDQEDLAGIYKRFTFNNVAIEAVHDGRADQVQIGIRGMLGSLYLADLANKVRRGMTGVIRDGRSPGGRAYGYRPKKGEPGMLDDCRPGGGGHPPDLPRLCLGNIAPAHRLRPECGADPPTTRHRLERIDHQWQQEARQRHHPEPPL